MGAVGDGEAWQVPNVLGRESVVVHPPVVRPVEVVAGPLGDVADGYIALDVLGRQNVPAIIWHCKLAGWKKIAHDVSVRDGWGTVDICVER